MKAAYYKVSTPIRSAETIMNKASLNSILKLHELLFANFFVPYVVVTFITGVF